MSDYYGLGSSHYAYSAGMDATYLDPLLIKPHTSLRGVRGARVTFGASDHPAVAADQAQEIIRINFPRIKTSRSASEGVGGQIFENLVIGSSWKRLMKGRRSRIWDAIQAIANSYGVGVGFSKVPGEDRRLTKMIFFSKVGSQPTYAEWMAIQDASASLDDEEGLDDFDFDVEDYGSVESEVDDLFDELDAEDDEYGRLYMGAEYHELDQAEPGDMGALIGRSGSSGYRGGRPSYGLADVHTPMGSITNINDSAAFFLGAGALLVFAKASGAW